MIDTFKALSEESRLKILALLVDRDMCVCDIEVALNMSQSNVSRHLGALKSSGIVESSKKAQWSFYKISEKFKCDYQYLWMFLRDKFDQSPYVEYKRIRDENMNCNESFDYSGFQIESTN